MKLLIFSKINSNEMMSIILNLLTNFRKKTISNLMQKGKSKKDDNSTVIEIPQNKKLEGKFITKIENLEDPKFQIFFELV